MSSAEIRFLAYDEVLMLHADQVRRYGGSPGIRVDGLLRSAIAQPEAQYDGVYLHDSIAAMAAAYLFHLVQNHPFIDGNKRIGAACAAAFLVFNGFRIDPATSEYESGSQQTQFERVVLDVAQGRMGKSQLTQWIQSVMQSA